MLNPLNVFFKKNQIVMNEMHEQHSLHLSLVKMPARAHKIYSTSRKFINQKEQQRCTKVLVLVVLYVTDITYRAKSVSKQQQQQQHIYTPQ